MRCSRLFIVMQNWKSEHPGLCCSWQGRKTGSDPAWAEHRIPSLTELIHIARMWAGCKVFFNFALGSCDVLWVTSLLLALFYRSESKGATVFTYLIRKMWGLINVCKDLVDHPPEMLHLCCVILIHCKKFPLNLFSPSNDLLNPRKYYCIWLRALFNMDYIFFRANDVRICVT